jgi:large subunit ribosomal protein L15
MQSHGVKRNTKRATSVQVGRGGRRGKTSGKGHKGQKARAGHKIRPELRDAIKKVPKLRGRGKNINTSRKAAYKVVKLSQLEEVYKANGKVTPQSLVDNGVIRKIGGKVPAIKIVAGGELKKKLEVSGIDTTKTAKEAIEKAGGKIM